MKPFGKRIPRRDYRRQGDRSSYADPATLMMALANGECDAYYTYASPVDATLIETFIGIDGLDIGESDFSGSYQMLFGCSRTPGDDVDFRQAIAYAIDYPTVGTAICGDYAKPSNRGVLNPAIKGFDETIAMLEYNPETAEAMLDEAGYVDSDGDGWRELKDGTAMDLVVIPQYSSTMEVRLRIAEIICTSLKNIGINCHIDEEAITNGEIWEDRVTNEDYDISITFCTSVLLLTHTLPVHAGRTVKETADGTGVLILNPILTEAFYNMTEAINDEQYLENSLILQHLADDEMFALTLAWQTAFFPYRTDKYDGWDNWDSWGVVNSETWFALTAK